MRRAKWAGDSNDPVARRLSIHNRPPRPRSPCFARSFADETTSILVRFENRQTGKAGYAPACGNEWAWGLCEKPRIRCTACPNQNFLPVTDQVVRWHLSGHDDSGATLSWVFTRCCGMKRAFSSRPTSTKPQWEEDARAILETCRGLELPAILETVTLGTWRTYLAVLRPGDPGDACAKLGAHLLTETMERRPGIGLDSYDRFFPNQDTLPQGGFGNLIALPLQKRAARAGQ